MSMAFLDIFTYIIEMTKNICDNTNKRFTKKDMRHGRNHEGHHAKKQAGHGDLSQFLEVDLSKCFYPYYVHYQCSCVFDTLMCQMYSI